MKQVECLHWWRRPAVLIVLCVCLDSTLAGYSVLSHEALIDAVWDPVIRPILLEAYPGATEAQLLEAHAYAYGGCVIQDMGYYPFGNRFFSDLTHYVRTGDFIKALLDQHQDMYEHAFALGALAHYVADNSGHPLAVNLSVPDMYPKLKSKYGRIVTFAQDPKAHVLVEFSFDVAQIAGAGYLPESYHNFIGFKVAKHLLERTFVATYGIEFKDLFLSEDLAMGTYRRGASEVIPRMTQIAWKQKKSQIMRVNPGMTRKKFVYRISRSNYEREWGNNYRRSRFFLRRLGGEEQELGLLARFLVFLFELLPKVGPLQTLNFKAPTPETQAMFVDSFQASLGQYRALLSDVRRNHLTLENKNLDTGKPTHVGEYELADRTYGKLLDKLVQDHFKQTAPELRSNILAFYGGHNSLIPANQDPEAWQKTLHELELLKAGVAPATQEPEMSR